MKKKTDHYITRGQELDRNCLFNSHNGSQKIGEHYLQSAGRN